MLHPSGYSNWPFLSSSNMPCPFLLHGFCVCCLLCLEHCHVPKFLQSPPTLPSYIFISRSLSVPHLREAIPDSQLKLYSFKHAAQSIVKPITLEKSYQVFSYVRLKSPLGWVPILSQVIVKFPGLFSFDTY